MRKKHVTRDVGIELTRVFACLVVIGVHTSLTDIVGGVYDPSRGLINCFLADGVAVFWLITGCFLFRNSSYKNTLVRTAKSIALPIAIYSIACLFFSGFIINGGPLIQFTYRSVEQYFQGFKDAIMLKQTVPLTGHLWYCYTYILVMIAFPVLSAFVQWLQEDNKRELWFCIISFVFLIVNDLTKNQTFAFSHHGLNAAVPAAIEMIWGSILYRKKEYLLKHKFLWIAAAIGFVVLNVIRMVIVWKTMTKAILYWYSSIGLLCGLCVIVFFAFVGKGLANKKVISKMVLWLAKQTFIIYLVHIPVISVLKRFNIPTIFLERLSLYTDGTLREILYTVGMILVVFLVSLVVSATINFITQLIHKVLAFKTLDTVK